MYRSGSHSLIFQTTSLTYAGYFKNRSKHQIKENDFLSLELETETNQKRLKNKMLQTRGT